VKAGLEAARTALSGEPAWLVGGCTRDRELGRASTDLDVVVDVDPAEAARAIARAAGGAACFALSEQFGAWRVVARDRSWQVDLEPLRGGSLERDLAMRDFTVNAIAEPISGGPPIDPLGGLADLAARRLRVAGPTAFVEDPLRVLRLVRVAVELDLVPEEETMRLARERVDGLRGVSGERVFAELCRIIGAAQALRGLELMHELGATAVVLPELDALRGLEQNRYHHLDVYGHTLEVLAHTIALAGDWDRIPEAAELEGHREAVHALFGEPLADGLTRGDALRWGALLHDAAKRLTQAFRPGDGRVTFIGHDTQGAQLARGVLERLRASERLRAHVAALVRHHLRAGFLVHEPQPLSRRSVYRYLSLTTPVEVDVTVLSIADRLATRGDRAPEAIAAHMRVAGGLLGDALDWRAEGRPRPLVRGDQLARALGIPAGPAIGELLDELAEAQYAGELSTPEQALAYAREHAAPGGRAPGQASE
jgi:putative nucleotidyltransferase with HDIG domain